ncbi:hypothetical protein XM38_044370 [Halomicronema hongdechloris C2206]|uniref:Metalloprotease TldD/E C-terminal domain-containing protein n=1 Tax=Halomicronema hongdechloris C2206 TaxID=1641165 RepID=A0A1Z3HT27_9CYAN|nr:metallopeptidase TldD-related protein [Halomicronema hongdechloris]ASC73470.1 hypothetical protein XM38_044370 [Halomicronema hongdechloris C2206]
MAWEPVFYRLVEALVSQLQPQEHIRLNLVAETSQFTRFNRARVRQSGQVVDGRLTLTLMAGQRTLSQTLPFTGELALDQAMAMATLEELRQELPDLPPDPYQVLPTGGDSSRDRQPGQLLCCEAVVPTVLQPLAGLDAVGFYAGGRLIRAYADSAGQRHWFERNTFTLDYSLFTADGKAIKRMYAGQHWDADEYQQQVTAAREHLAQLAHPAKVMAPGTYRTYLEPAAVADLVTMVGRSGVGAGALRRGSSPLGLLQRGERRLSGQIHLREDFSQGQVPRFNQDGDLAAMTLPVIQAGRLINELVSARSAREYGLASTAAAASEAMRSQVLAGGTLPRENALAALDTGLYVSNLHYLNWSDRPQGYLTGMTRYACFWVANGQIVAPIENLRFDESLYHFWGDNLVNLTQESEWIAQVSTYDHRRLGGTWAPGMLVDAFTYTL